VLLAGAVACAQLGDVPAGMTTPAPEVPELVAVAVRGAAAPVTGRHVDVGEWQPSWTPQQHAAAVSAVREAIARGDVYQANVVGHRSAPHRSAPRDLALAVAGIGASYAGVLTGEGWAVGCASPEQLVRVDGRRITTAPIKGTRRVTPGSLEELRASEKDRAEHVMIVDLERNDLARVCVPHSVHVPDLLVERPMAGVRHLVSRVQGRLRLAVGLAELLRATFPGGSITGAPKISAINHIARLEPVGRGASMGALGRIYPNGDIDLGLTIRTFAVADGRIHLWVGGGIVWDSDPAAEVEESLVKARPLLRLLGSPHE
jgi:para-aminobenzoate synthetase component 1